MKAGAVLLLGLVLAMPAWGHSDDALLPQLHPFPKHPNATPFREASIEVSRYTESGYDHRSQFLARIRALVRSGSGYTARDGRCSIWCTFYLMREGHTREAFNYREPSERDTPWGLDYDTDYVFAVADYINGAPHPSAPPGTTSTLYVDAVHHVHYRTPPKTPSEPETPTTPPPEPEPETPTPPEPPAPPPDPEPPSPPPEPEPEPEVPDPDPEAPDHSHPVERCDHLAIVPAMPRALSGDEDAPDHWIRITNPGAEGITFTVEGRDEAGTKAGTYRRELPAYRSVKVKMRDVEAAFDAAKPEGWWTLTVTGSGPLHVFPLMRDGEGREVLPVERPTECAGGR